MSSASLNSFDLVQFNFRHVETGASLVVNCISRESTANNLAWFPVLNEITGVGDALSSRDGVPRASRGTIHINNVAGTFGAERKFSDLFQHYTLIESEVVFMVAYLPVDTAPSSLDQFTVTWRAKVIDYASAGDALRIAFSRSYLPTRTITKQVTRATFPNAPESSLGQTLPIIVGEFTEVDSVQVRGNYTESSEDRIDIAYGTTYGNKFIPSDSAGANEAQVFLRNQVTDEYERITFKATAFTPVYSQPFTGASDADFWENLKSIAYQLKPSQNVIGGEAIVGVNWYLALRTGGDPNGRGQYTLTIYADANGYPGQELAKSTCEINTPRKQFLGTFNGRQIYTFRFYLDRLIQIPHSQPVFVGLTRNDPDENFLPFTYDEFSPFEKYRILEFDDQDMQANTGEFERVVTTFGKDAFDVWGLAVTHDVSGGSSGTWQDGLGHVQLSLCMRTQDFVPDLSRESFIIRSRGMRDDSSGSITGSANSLLTQPRHVLHALLHDWSGSAWTNTLADMTAFNATHNAVNATNGAYPIALSGFSKGRTTLVQLIDSIAYNSGAKIIPLASGRVGLYFLGTNRDKVGIFDEDNTRLRSYEIQGVSSMVNRFRAVYDQSIQRRTESLLSEGGLHAFNGSFDSAFNSVNVDPALLQRSLSRFGALEMNIEQFDFISDATSMRSLASLYIQTYMFPLITCVIECPRSTFDKYNLYDRIDLYSTGMPAEDGTTLDAYLPTSGTGNTAVDILSGHFFMRAQRYPCIILSKSVILGRAEQPTIRFILGVVNQGAKM